jgi:hypothetical protein
VAIPKKRPRTTLAPITEDEHWQQLRRCLHDNTLPTPVRAAGTLVLLYGLPVSRVATLRHDDIHTDTNQRVWLRYGDHQLRLPPAVATVVLAQRDHASTASAIGRGKAWPARRAVRSSGRRLVDAGKQSPRHGLAATAPFPMACRQR